MGYFVSLNDSTVVIPTEYLDDAYEAVCRLNAYDNLKTGGSFSYSPTPKPADSASLSNNPDAWFAWMDWNYDETCEDLQEVLDMLGFGTNMVDEGLEVSYYNDKTGQEELFLNAISKYIPDGQYMEWSGEDGSVWKWTFQDGVMIEQEGKITWE